MTMTAKPHNPPVVAVTSTFTSRGGSMARYHDLVVRVLRQQGLQVRELSLACPVHMAGPAGIWLNHAWIRFFSTQRIEGTRGCDLIHLTDGSYAYAVRRNQPAPMVVTAHDVIPWLQCRGSFAVPVPRAPARLVIRASIRGLSRARHIVAVSQRTASDVTVAGIDPARISVVRSAVALRPSPCTRNQSSARDSFVLHVGNNGFYKNRMTVLRVFAALRNTHAARLVLAGAPLSPAERAEIAMRGIGHDVECLNEATDDDLHHLYTHASVLLFPSLYEGFGWPPLEAMAHGCPVVCSNAGSLPEVVGDAALTADPMDVETLATHCSRVLAERELRKSLQEKGRENVARFTEERMGRELLDVYDRVWRDL